MLTRWQVLFRLARGKSNARPVLVHIDYHTDAEARMAAVIAHYLQDDSRALGKLPLQDTSARGAASEAGCDAARAWSAGACAAGGSHARVCDTLQRESPWAWGGVGDLVFKPDGKLETPWGAGTWGAHDSADGVVFADFVGSKHNVRLLPSGLGVSTRCSDANTVLVRSIRAAKERASKL